MSVLVAPLLVGIATAVVQTGLTALVTPDQDIDIPELETRNTADLEAAADEEAKRRGQNSSQLMNPTSIGPPNVRVGTPTIVMGGPSNA
jgi:hypothetical protein